MLGRRLGPASCLSHPYPRAPLRGALRAWGGSQAGQIVVLP